jgi:hypothetical protein
MSTSSLEPFLDNVERRVKPKLEDVDIGGTETDLLGEAAGTQSNQSASKLENLSPKASIFESVCELTQNAPNYLSLSQELKSSESFAASPGGNAPSVSDLPIQCAPSPSVHGIAADAVGSESFQGQSAQTSTLPSCPQFSQNVGNVVCSGGSATCTTPHLPVKIRGMCNSCYQREYRKNHLASIPPRPPQVKSEPKPRQIVDPRILCDEHGVPMLDGHGLPIVVRTHMPMPIIQPQFRPYV